MIFQSLSFLGALDGGMGETHVNKLMTCLDIPKITDKIFKKHEIEVGQAAEELAMESCEEAARVERVLTLENEQVLSNLL